MPFTDELPFDWGRAVAEAFESVEATLFAGDESLCSPFTRSLSLFFFFFFRSRSSTGAPSAERPSLALRFSALLRPSSLSILIPPTSTMLVFRFFSFALSALSAFLTSSLFRLSG